MLQKTVKATAATHLTDARYFAAWEVEFLGFDLGPEGISPLELNAFREWITGPLIVGELDAAWLARQADEVIAANLAALRLDAVQVPAIFEPANIVAHLQPLDIPIFLEVPVEGYFSVTDLQDILEQHHGLVTYNILNFTKGGVTWNDLLEGSPFELEALRKMSEKYPLFLEIEGPPPTGMYTQLPALKGFSVRGGSEEKVGYKDFDELDAFFEDIEVFE